MLKNFAATDLPVLIGSKLLILQMKKKRFPKNFASHAACLDETKSKSQF